MASPHGEAEASGPPNLMRYLPLAAVATALVVALPAFAISLLTPEDDPAILLLSVPLAMGSSIAVAAALSALWTRQRGSVDLVFGELMLWGWLRRFRAERRLGEAATLMSPDRSARGEAGHADEGQVEMLRGLSSLLERRDPYTHGHSRRVTRHVERIARCMGLSAAEVAKVRTAASMHDIGKIHTPRRILHRPGKLTSDEISLVRRHAVDGATLVAAIGDQDITALVRHHHERFDGGGYPDGMAGDEIPLGARIIAVADSFDAMTSHRPYRKALSHKQALDEIEKESGAQFDPAVVSAFLGHYSSERSIAWFSFAAAGSPRMVAFGASLFQGVGGGAAAGIGSAAQGAAAAGLAALLGLSLGGDIEVPSGSARPDRASVTREAPPGAVTDPSPHRSPDRSAQPQEGNGREVSGPKAGGPAPARPQRDNGGLRSDAPGATPGRALPAPVPQTVAPPWEVPAVKVPPVRVPPVETPPVQVPPVETPPVQVPPVQGPGVSPPGLKVGQVKAPAVRGRSG